MAMIDDGEGNYILDDKTPPTPTGEESVLPEAAPDTIADFSGEFDTTSSEQAADSLVVPTTEYITPEATVSGQLNTLLAEDSAYLNQAEVKAKEQAQKSGMLTSSMAVGAAERERIAAALPIAQQDASTYSDSAALSQNTAATSVLEGQKSDAAVYAANVSGKIQSDIEAFSQEQTTMRANTELEVKERMANTELDATAQTVYTEAASTLGANFEKDISAILQSQDFATETDRTEAVVQVQAIYVNNMDFLASASGVTLDWDDFGEAAVEDLAVLESTAYADAEVAKAEAEIEDTRTYDNFGRVINETSGA